MTTSNDPRGRLAELYSARQTSLATPAAAPAQPFTRRHFYGFSPTPQSEPQDDPLLGGGFHNSVDDRPGAPDVERGSLRVGWPLDLVQIGWALQELLGEPETTGAGPYVHSFTSSTVQVPTTTFERLLSAGAFDGVHGAVCRSLQFPIGADRGYVRVNADYVVRKVEEQYAASIAGDFDTPLVDKRVPRAAGTIKRNGVDLGSIISGDVTITNQLGEDSYHGSRYIDDVAMEGRGASMSLTGRFKGAALREFGAIPAGQIIQQPMDIELVWPLGPSLKLELTVRNLRFAKVGVATEGPGRLDVQLRGRGEIGADAAMVSAVLTNGQATYA